MNATIVGGRPARRRGGGRARVAAGCAAAAALLAGCTLPNTPTASGAAPAGASITVASVPSVGDAPLYVAWQSGLFRQAGLTVVIRSYKSAAAEMAALRDGRASVAVGDYADFFYAQDLYIRQRNTRAQMVVLADGYDAAPNIMDVLVSPNSPITAPQDLQGKIIGTAEPQLMPDRFNGPPYSLETVAASSALEDDGIQPTSVTWRPMPATDLVSALRNHTVNAILATEPQIFQAEAQLGARTILDACSGETVNLPLEGYFAPRSFAARHRAALLAFRSALIRAQAGAVQPAPLQAAFQHYAGMSRQDASLITVGVYPTSLKVTSLQRVADLMSFYGALPQPLDVGPMVFR